MMCVRVCVCVCRGTEAQTFQNICQGDWDIEAVDLGAIAQTNNGLVKPIGFKTAKVTGKAYMCMPVCAFMCIMRVCARAYR